jgi:hypothetical protein
VAFSAAGTANTAGGPELFGEPTAARIPVARPQEIALAQSGSEVIAAVVAGALANKPQNGGEAWVRLSWVLGLRRLGFEVYLVEEIAPETCVDASGRPSGFEDSINRAYFERITSQFGISDRSILICGDLDATWGAQYAEILERARGAELLFNISGHLKRDELLSAPSRRVYVDLDPGFTQLWGAAGEPGLGLRDHEHHVTVGTNVGSPGCPLPTGGLRWEPTLPPVLMDEWPALDPPERVARFTTVASWRGPYGPVELGGELQGLKHHEFRKLVDLPKRAPGLGFEIALSIDPADSADLDALRTNGWHVVDPREVAGDPGRYRKYIRGSGAECSVAQGIYVSTTSGWFSDRTASYLASGRPALIQDTGISSTLPVGEGLLVFSDIDGAVRGGEAIARDYAAHSRSAREIAERYLDSDVVLSRLLERLSASGASL